MHNGKEILGKYVSPILQFGIAFRSCVITVFFMHAYDSCFLAQLNVT